jgi:hypothetical protein
MVAFRYSLCAQRPLLLAAKEHRTGQNCIRNASAQMERPKQGSTGTRRDDALKLPSGFCAVSSELGERGRRFPRIEPGLRRRRRAREQPAGCGRAAPTGGGARPQSTPCFFSLLSRRPGRPAHGCVRLKTCTHGPRDQLFLRRTMYVLQYTAPTATILLTGRCMCYVFHIFPSLELPVVVVSSATLLLGLTHVAHIAASVVEVTLGVCAVFPC